jgi:predicted RNase H-like HicB family nuclease
MRDYYIYPAVFTFADDGVSIEFPDLPGCLPCADNEEEAFKNAKEALALHLYGMEEDSDEIPEPSKISSIELEKNQAVALIDIYMVLFRDKMATKAVNKMLTLPKWLADLGEREKVNFSGIFQRALKEHLGVKDYTPIKRSKSNKI